MDKLYAIKIKKADGTYGSEIPISALAENITWDNSHTLMDILGYIDTSTSVQAQINNLVGTKANQNDLNILQTRVDNIITPTGEAPSAAEVQDARIGADGITYDTVGNAIREQISNLNNVMRKYIFDKTISINATWIRASINTDGSLNTNTTWRLSTSEMIEITDDVVIIIDAGYAAQYALYNGDGSFIERKTLTSGMTLDVGMYVRFSIYKSQEATTDDPRSFFNHISMEYVSYKTLNPSDYGSLLANVKDDLIAIAANNAWNDAPWTNGISVTGIFISRRYSWNYNLQEYIVINTGLKWHRIINRTNGSVYRDWTTDNTLQPMKILALGDSICAGYRNGGKGFVGDLGLPYKNIGVSGATISNKVTSVTNIPNQLTAESGYDPDIIIADGGINDYTHGAPLGTVPTKPASTEAEANALNRDTVSGALGFLFYTMIKKYPKAQRFFVIVHKMYYPAGDMYYPTFSNGSYTQQDLHDLTVEMCHLYNVKVIDVYNDGIINTLFPEYVSPTDYDSDTSVTYTQYVNSDGIHPLDLGYREGYVPLVRQAIEIGTKKVITT